MAFQGFEEVRENYVAALAELLEGGSYVGIATHDEWLVEEGKRLVAEHGLEATQYEFQMLLGVRERLGESLVADGRRLRIYVPFGEHWYAYSLRRLQENPKIAGYIAARHDRPPRPGTERPRLEAAALPAPLLSTTRAGPRY